MRFTTTAVTNGIAVDATSIYWTDATDVYKAPKSGGTAVPLAKYSGGLATVQYANDFVSIAVDATRVVWSTSGTQYGHGAVFSVAK
jgi:hypothetical protein